MKMNHIGPGNQPRQKTWNRTLEVKIRVRESMEMLKKLGGIGAPLMLDMSVLYLIHRVDP